MMRVADAFTDKRTLSALVQLGPATEVVVPGTELPGTTWDGDAEVGTDDVTKEDPGTELKFDVELGTELPGTT